ncbi:MAG: hypothetical protein K0R54_213 [Clostridiaceae bacterium]|jgi:hypothetical protein|nr:hypothetical protein [Clostridiaceae bacterium]
MNNIKFTDEEIKKYPLLSNIEIGQCVLALDNNDYAKLRGVISDIKYGKDKETENEDILDIYVDFEEPENLDELYPHLNGTGVDQLIMAEDMLGFYFEAYEVPISINNMIVCENCCTEVKIINETQYDDIKWTFENGDYKKENLQGDTAGKTCGNCGERLGNCERILNY